MRYLNSELEYTEPVITPENVLAIANAAHDDSDGIYELYKDELVTIDCGMYGAHQFRLVGTMHDDLADGSGKAGLSFFCEDCIGTSALNANDTSNSGGYVNHNATMTTYLTNVFNAMPQEWRNIMKPVKKVYSTNKTATSTINFNNLWIASMWEVGLYDSSCCAKEGTTYKYFEGTVENGTDPKRVRNNGGSANYWWLRSGSFLSTSSFVRVLTNGSWGGSYPQIARGVVPGFCVT